MNIASFRAQLDLSLLSETFLRDATPIRAQMTIRYIRGTYKVGGDEIIYTGDLQWYGIHSHARRFVSNKHTCVGLRKVDGRGITVPA